MRFAQIFDLPVSGGNPKAGNLLGGKFMNFKRGQGRPAERMTEEIISPCRVFLFTLLWPGFPEVLLFEDLQGTLFQKLNLRFDFVEVFFLHPVDEEDSVKVVDFMLYAAGKKPVTYQLMRVAIQILVTYRDPFGACDFSAKLRERQTALFIIIFFGGKGNNLGLARAKGITIEGGKALSSRMQVMGYSGWSGTSTTQNWMALPICWAARPIPSAFSMASSI